MRECTEGVCLGVGVGRLRVCVRDSKEGVCVVFFGGGWGVGGWVGEIEGVCERQ